MPSAPKDVNSGWHNNADTLSDQGKRRDSARTRVRILDAAQQLFAARGYSQVGMREVAATAGVDVKMVARYFGAKDKLFAAALSASTGTSDLWSRPKENFGQAVVNLFINDRDAALNPLKMLVQAASDPAAKAVALEFVRTELINAIADWLGPPHAHDRAVQILALCAGFFTYRVMLPTDQFAGPASPRSAHWLAAALQAVVDDQPDPSEKSGIGNGPAWREIHGT